jgi:hypothetical protein
MVNKESNKTGLAPRPIRNQASSMSSATRMGSPFNQFFGPVSQAGCFFPAN